MINPNKFIGLKQQESMGPLTDPLQAEQDFLAKRMSQPVAVPGNQNQAISPVMQTNYPHAPGTKYKAVNVQDLEDMGRIKKDKISQYVVNSNEMKTGTSRDTLRLPKDAKHYSGKKYKTGQMIDESDFEDFTKQYNK